MRMLKYIFPVKIHTVAMQWLEFSRENATHRIQEKEIDRKMSVISCRMQCDVVAMRVA